MLDFSGVKVLSFDCYGTLIDWETGILSALRPLMTHHGVGLPDQQLLELYGRFEREAQSQSPFVNYRTVLRNVLKKLGAHLALPVKPAEESVLADSLGDWPPFSDTVEALRLLKSRFQLAIISNVDDDMFNLMQEHLQVPFDWVITSEQLGLYKPSESNFQSAMRTMGITPDQHAHVAQSLYHDIRPAGAMGLNTVWVNRPGAASTPVIGSKPSLEVPDLKSLADLAVRASRPVSRPGIPSRYQ